VTLHADALATLTSWRAPDERQDRLRRSYVDHLEAHPDAMLRTCHPAHLTAGALVLSADHARVLLTLHAKAHRWFHLGGHCEGHDETLADAALREAAEESGINDLQLDPCPIHLDEHVVTFCGPQGRVSHLDVRFVAVAPEGAEPVTSEESIEVRWWPVDSMPTDDADLVATVSAALARQVEGSGSMSSCDAAATPSR
jgi:8-oxo-dGTP pyrophosphatase MutT (NUDIX family)